MKAILQRVHRASVTCQGKITAQIQKGIVALLGVAHDDTQRDIDIIVDKIIHLRIFQDENDKMNRSVLDIQGELLIVSQFTLLADLGSGRRPSLSNAAAPLFAQQMYEKVISLLKKNNLKVETGNFGEHMDISLVNDGPVTFFIDTKALQATKKIE